MPRRGPRHQGYEDGCGPGACFGRGERFGRSGGFWRPGGGGPGRRTLYRSRRGVLLGVCRGLAEYAGVSVVGLRVAMVVVVLATGLWPGVIFYLLAAVLMKPEPVIQPHDDRAREFYDSYAGSRSLALSRLKDTFDRLDRRIRRMEDIVTSRDYQWKRRFDE